MKRCYLILSLFLILAGAISAQPQAPITWGQPRLIRVFPADTLCHYMRAKGDTVVFCCDFNFRLTLVNRVYITTDLGRTWQLPYNTWDSAYLAQGNIADAEPSVAITNNAIYVQNPLTQTVRAIWKTTNNGISWTRQPLPYNWRLRIDDHIGDTLICYYDSAQTQKSIARTWNGGQTIQRLYSIPYNSRIQATTNYYHLLTITVPDLNLHYGRFNRITGDFINDRLLSTAIPHTYYGLAFSDSESIIWFLNNSAIAQVFAQTSPDYGTTWSNPIEFTQGETSDSGPASKSHESLCLLAYGDTIHEPGYNSGGQRAAFTANSGKSWYPPQLFYVNPMGLVAPDYVDYTANLFRVYLVQLSHTNNNFAMYYIDGIVHPDTIPPVVTISDSIPNQLPANTSLILSLMASDNDSVWQVRFHWRAVNDTVWQISLLTRDSIRHYRGTWTPPHPGNYEVYYASEDMWKHVTTFPANAISQPHRLLVGTAGIAESINLPSDLSFHIFPNPGNATFTIVGTLPNTRHATLTIYDLQGREVFHSSLPSPTANHQSFHYIWDGRNQRGVPVASGVYYCRISGNVNAIKIAVLR